MLMKTIKTHVSSVVFGNTLVNVRAVRPVYQYPWGGVSGNINNEKNKKNKELKMADKT